MSGALSTTRIGLSMECKGGSLCRLTDAHSIEKQFQRTEVPLFDEFNWSVVLKMTIGSIEKDAGMRLVAGIKIHERNPNSIDATQLALQAAGVGMFANSWSLAADCFSDYAYGHVQFPSDACGIKTARLRVEEAGIGSEEGVSCEHKAHHYLES
jgi:hypothetical protein